jgi:hypothetical protein
MVTLGPFLAWAGAFAPLALALRPLAKKKSFFVFFQNPNSICRCTAQDLLGLAIISKKLLQQQAKPLAVALHPSLSPFPTLISAVEAKAKALPLGLRNQSIVE